MVDVIWDAEKTARLKSMHAAGKSVADIAEAVGRTRNAVCGKVHRLGLGETRAFKAPQQPKPPRPKKPRAPRAFVPTLVSLGSGGFSKEPRPAPIARPKPVEPSIPFANRCTLLDLKPDSCRWPVGEVGADDFFYCGSTSPDGLSYCAYHCRVAYQPRTPSVRKTPLWRGRA